MEDDLQDDNFIAHYLLYSFLVSTVKGARSPQEQTAARRSHESEFANASAMEGKIFPLLSLNSPAMTMFFPSMARSVTRGKS